MNRRQIFKSAFGALALASGIPQNAIARTGAATPDYARLSNAVLNSHGLAAGNVWTRTNTGSLESDDLVRASLLLRLTADHFEEIEWNAYLDTQLSQPPVGIISRDVVHAIGERIRSYGILLTDAQIESMYPADVNAMEQGLLYATQVGIRGLQVQIADSLDLAAAKLRS